eukprot:gene16296-5241_t
MLLILDDELRTDVAVADATVGAATPAEAEKCLKAANARRGEQGLPQLPTKKELAERHEKAVAKIMERRLGEPWLKSQGKCKINKSMPPISQMRKLWKLADKYMQRSIIAMAHVVLMTCQLSSTWWSPPRVPGKRPLVKQVIIDEAGFASEPLTLLPIVAAFRAAYVDGWRLALVGDHKQLAPVVTSHHDAAEAALSASLFERLADLAWDRRPPFVMLERQYRMHPDIAAFSSQEFYDGRLSTAARTARDTAAFPPGTERLGSHAAFLHLPSQEDHRGKGAGAETSRRDTNRLR